MKYFDYYPITEAGFIRYLLRKEEQELLQPSWRDKFKINFLSKGSKVLRREEIRYELETIAGLKHCFASKIG